MGYKTCPYCGAHLDPGKTCDCREEDGEERKDEKEPAGGQPGQARKKLTQNHYNTERKELQ